MGKSMGSRDQMQSWTRCFTLLLATIVCGCQASPASRGTLAVHAVHTALPQRSYAAIDYGKDTAPRLSPSEGRALMSMLRFHPAENGAPLMYAKYRGTLVMYYGNSHYPSGAVPLGDRSCAEGNSSPCLLGYHLIGSDNGVYFPEPDGFFGSHISFTNSNNKTFVDDVARSIYAREHLARPWEPTR